MLGVYLALSKSELNCGKLKHLMPGFVCRPYHTMTHISLQTCVSLRHYNVPNIVCLQHGGCNLTPLGRMTSTVIPCIVHVNLCLNSREEVEMTPHIPYPSDASVRSCCLSYFSIISPLYVIVLTTRSFASLSVIGLFRVYKAL